MSYSDYQYPSSSGYESYSQQYNTRPYSSSDQQAQLAHYDYTSSQSLDQYAQPAASIRTDYIGYNSTTDTEYTSAPTTGYSGYTPYQYSQDSVKVDQFSARSSGVSDSTSGSFSTSVSHYTSGTTTQDQGSGQPVSDYGSYHYQPTNYSQVSSSHGQDSTPLASDTESYDHNSSGYTYQDEPPSQPSSSWASSDQYTSYYEESTSGTGYNQKNEPEFQNTNYSSSIDAYSQARSSGGGGGYSQPDIYSATDGGGYSQPDIYSATDDGNSYQDYVKLNINQVVKPQQHFEGYSSSSHFVKGSDGSDRGGGRNYSNEKVDSIGVASSSSPCYYSGELGRGSRRGDFRGGYKDNINSRGSNSFSRGQDRAFSAQKFNTQRCFNQTGDGSSGSVRGFSNRGNRGGNFSARGSFLSSNSGNWRSTVVKPPLGTFDARNKINEARSCGTAAGKLITNFPPSTKSKFPVPPYKPPEQSKKEVFKAPSRPQDRLLNEIEEKKKAQQAEELKKSEVGRKKAEEERKKAEEERKKAEEERKKAEEKRLKALEEEKRLAEEELRKKVAEEAVKAAPPSKTPETAEEIAHEQEIQRKIRESLVIINPQQEIALMKNDPTKDIEMSEELRKLLKTLTTDYLCKLCSVRVAGAQMAAMHYNGKNHIKKLRNFVHTNGRSAGFNMDKSENDVQKEEKAGEKNAEIVEITDLDEKQYCKVCKISFSQEQQAEMHYNGKNHARKMKSIGTGNGPEVFECKICSVTVTAQEHMTAHLSGSRHKQQVKKLDTNQNYRGGSRGRGRGFGFRGRGRGASRGGGQVNDGDWRPLPQTGNRGRGFRGRGHIDGDNFWRGRGFKRHMGFDDGLSYRGDFGPSFTKRPRF